MPPSKPIFIPYLFLPSPFERGNGQDKQHEIYAYQENSEMFELKVVDHFAAAHQLKMVAEKCENLHGHNWKVEVYVAGKQLNAAGVLIDFGELKKQLSQVMDTLDHKFLNELDFLGDGNPSSENIAKYIAAELQNTLGNEAIHISRVAVWESENACATYIPA